jgi:uncharacterized membrane protein (DUF2068 family)
MAEPPRQLAPGVAPARRRFSLRYELIGCGLHGHALVGVDAAKVRAEDAALARVAGSLRWHRCLRCDAWLWVPEPESPTAEVLPAREEIELPLRGRPLRDRYVLRLIAIDRAIHVVVLSILAIVVFVVAAHEATLRADFTRVVTDLQGSGPTSRHGFLAEVQKAFSLSHGSLYALGAAAIGYAVLEAVEMVGLWQARRWAEYLTFIATILLLPIEIYELTGRISALKIITLIINLAIAIYLLLAKRLFGLRGGGAHERAERAHDLGWGPIERATPPF